MNGFALLLATALLGVDYGWQPASDGRLEYIIQLEPVTLIALREGQEVVSQIDPFVRDVRRFRIRVGTDVVPRMGTPAPGAVAAPPATTAAPPPGVSYGWQPVNAQQVELFVQIAPERLIALQNDPIVGEIPFELKNVARVRIRSGVAELPRQNLAAAAPVAPAAAAVPLGNAPAAGASGPAPAAGNALGAAAGAGAAAGLVGAAAANPASSWPANNGNPAARQPSRYDPPANAAAPTAAAPAGDPRAAAAFNAGPTGPAVAPPAGVGTPQNPTAGWPSAPAANTPLQQPASSWQNAAGQPPNTSWPVANQPATGGLSLPQPPIAPIAVSPPVGQGLTDPNASSGWSSGTPAAGVYAGVQPPASASPGWGTPDDRFTTERGQWTGNAPTAGAASSSSTPMVPLPQGPAQPPSQAWPSAPPSSSSWLSSFAAAGPAGEMVSPFADPLTPASRPADSAVSPTQSPWGSAAGTLTPVGFSGDTNKKKQPDFWADLAAAANDPSTDFLRDTPEASSAASDKPWWPLTLAMLALFASLGGNLYMGWIAVDVYRRYLEMADDGIEEDEDEDSPRPRDDRRDWEDSPRRRERVAVED